MARRFTAGQYDAWIRFDSESRRHTNCIRFGLNESPAHRRAKIEKAVELFDLGHLFITEAEFEDGSGKADIADLDSHIAYEVRVSESEKSLNDKRVKYPKMFRIEVICPKLSKN